MMAADDGPEGVVRASCKGAGMLHATHPHGHTTRVEELQLCQCMRG
jgi:hypothetical protein